jgi:hypothetical protein
MRNGNDGDGLGCGTLACPCIMPNLLVVPYTTYAGLCYVNVYLCYLLKESS